jgi:integrase
VRGSKTEVSPGVWRLRVFTGNYRPNGSTIVVSRTVRSPDQRSGAGSRLADRELAKLIAEVSTGKVRNGATRVDALLDDWLAHLETLGRSPTTLHEYRRLVDRVVKPELGHIRLSKLTARHLDQLYQKLVRRELKPNSIRRVHATIGAALHQAEKWELVDRSVARQATPPSVHAEPMTAPTPQDVGVLLQTAEAMEPPLAVLLLLAALTGARRGELCALRWTDVNWRSGLITFARSVYETHGGGWAEKATKTHQVRSVAVDDYALTVLRRHRAGVDELAKRLELHILEDGFVFSRSPAGAEPYMPNFVSKFVLGLAKKTGIDVHLHSLRHFSATELIAGGHDIRTVAGRLGHADPSITLRVYSHVLPQRDREAAAALGHTLAALETTSSRLRQPS